MGCSPCTCHCQPLVDFSGAQYHKLLWPQSLACLDCHVFAQIRNLPTRLIRPLLPTPGVCFQRVQTAQWHPSNACFDVQPIFQLHYLNTLLYDRPNMVIYRVSKAAVDFNNVQIWDGSSFIESVSLLNFGEPWPSKARILQRGNPPPCRGAINRSYPNIFQINPRYQRTRTRSRTSWPAPPDRPCSQSRRSAWHTILAHEDVLLHHTKRPFLSLLPNRSMFATSSCHPFLSHRCCHAVTADANLDCVRWTCDARL